MTRIAKVFENGITSRLTTFLNTSEELSDRQYAYRAGRSTTMLAREVIRRISFAREARSEVAVLFCDLSKAFDVVDHVVLSKKLHHYGIRGTALELMTDFLNDRRQFVVGQRGNLKSDGLSPEIGVPQGSSLSNLAFSILLNDLPNVVNAGEVFMYADDVAAIVTAKNLEELESQLNSAAQQIFDWCKLNGMLLNLTKTQFIQFDLSGRPRRSLLVHHHGITIERVAVTTFLGFQLDQGLTWETQIGAVCGKLSRACFALSRVSHTLQRQSVRSCYFASIQAVLQYGLEFWGRAADWQRVFRLQKRAVRILARAKHDESAKPHFIALGILTLPSLLVYQIAVYARENLSLYARRGDGCTRITRNANKLSTISHKLRKTTKTVHVAGPVVYNKIPQSITAAVSLPVFKIKLKKWLIQQCFYSFKEFIEFKEIINNASTM